MTLNAECFRMRAARIIEKKKSLGKRFVKGLKECTRIRCLLGFMSERFFPV